MELSRTSYQPFSIAASRCQSSMIYIDIDAHAIQNHLLNWWLSQTSSKELWQIIGKSQISYPKILFDVIIRKSPFIWWHYRKIQCQKSWRHIYSAPFLISFKVLSASKSAKPANCGQCKFRNIWGDFFTKKIRSALQKGPHLLPM